MATRAPCARRAAAAGDGPVPARLPASFVVAPLAATLATGASTTGRGVTGPRVVRPALPIIQGGTTVTVGATEVAMAIPAPAQAARRRDGDVAAGFASARRARVLLVGLAAKGATEAAPARPQVLTGVAASLEVAPGVVATTAYGEGLPAGLPVPGQVAKPATPAETRKAAKVGATRAAVATPVVLPAEARPVPATGPGAAAKEAQDAPAVHGEASAARVAAPLQVPDAPRVVAHGVAQVAPG